MMRDVNVDLGLDESDGLLTGGGSDASADVSGAAASMATGAANANGASAETGTVAAEAGTGEVEVRCVPGDLMAERSSS